LKENQTSTKASEKRVEDAHEAENILKSHLNSKMLSNASVDVYEGKYEGKMMYMREKYYNVIDKIIVMKTYQRVSVMI